MAVTEKISVYGILNHQAEVERCLDTLRAGGFRAEDISLVYADTAGPKHFSFEKETKAPEGAALGAAAGGAVGGVLGWLVSVGAIAIPGLGPFVAAGPILGLLAGAGAGAAAGGLTGALIGIGIPEYEVKRYEGLIHTGRVLISVHCDNDEWKHKAKSILEASGASHIASGGEARADVPMDPHGVPERATRHTTRKAS